MRLVIFLLITGPTEVMVQVVHGLLSPPSSLPPYASTPLLFALAVGALAFKPIAIDSHVCA